MKNKIIKVSICFFVIILVAIVFASNYLLNYSMNKSKECYAKWDSARLVIAYLYLNDNQLPSNWSDLSSVYDKTNLKGPLDLNEIEKIIKINFDVELNKKIVSGIAVNNMDMLGNYISAINGNKNHFKNSEPNKMISNYINSKNKKSYIFEHNIITVFKQ